MYLYAHPSLAWPEGLSFICVMQREHCCINLVPRPSPTHDHRFNIQLRKVEWKAFDSLGTRLLLSHVHSIHYQAPNYVPGAGPTDGFLGPPRRNATAIIYALMFLLTVNQGSQTSPLGAMNRIKILDTESESCVSVYKSSKDKWLPRLRSDLRLFDQLKEF